MKMLISGLRLLLTWAPWAALPAQQIGIVLMHGKWGSAAPQTPVGQLAAYLRQHGMLVSTPDMPWSKRRGLDRSYEDSMAEIDQAIAQLKEQGARRIVVAGQSMGANAALGYGARRSGLAGTMAIASGHVPESSAYQARMDQDWRRAKTMVDAGQGDVTTEFKDLSQGKISRHRIKPRIYLGWYDPAGAARIPVNAANLKVGTPLLWFVGREGRMAKRGPRYAFARAPDHPQSAYVVVQGGHKATPLNGKRRILEWLQRLQTPGLGQD